MEEGKLEIELKFREGLPSHVKIIEGIYDYLQINNISESDGLSAMSNMIIYTFLSMDSDSNFQNFLSTMKESYYLNKKISKK